MKKHIIKELYQDPVHGFVSIPVLQRKLKERGHIFTRKEIEKELQQLEAYTLNKPRVSNFERRKYYVPDIDVQWQMDLTFLNVEKVNDGVKGLLTVIDLFSRYAWVRPLKTKTGIEVAQAIESIFKEGRIPEKIQVDKGSEFYNKNVKELLKKYNVEMFSIHNETKSAFVESFNRTLKRRMTRLFDTTQSFRYIDSLQKMVKGYNTTRHSAIKMTPTEASKKENYEEVYNNQYGNDIFIDDDKPKYKIKDYVRIPIEKGRFSKEGTGNYSIEIFQISEIKNTNPITYGLVDLMGEIILGSFYEQELVKVDAKAKDILRIDKILKTTGTGKNKKHLIKWLGYPDKFNSWVLDKDLINL